MRFCGKVGYVIIGESDPETGIWKDDEVVEKVHKGDVLKSTIRNVPSQNLNDDLNVSNRISIIANPFAYLHAHNIKYVVWMGAKWKVTDIEIERPRIILTIGGVYNG